MFNIQRVFIILLLLFYWPSDAEKSSINLKNDTKPSSQLVFANVIFRHGDRTPVSSYPTSLYNNESHWPRGYGQLTNLGIAQTFELGEFLRRRYESLLGVGKYPFDIVFIQSTDYDRTLMSGTTCLAALFPPKNDEIWRDDFAWQPVPIHSIPKHQDYILYGGKHCPRYDRAIRSYFDSPEFIALIAKHNQLFKYLEEMSGAQIKSFEDVAILYNTLWIENLKYKTLPEWANDEVFGVGTDFEWCANYDFKIPTDTPELARLSTGFLLREMLEHFTEKIKSTLHSDRSLFLYSAHDMTIANVLNSLGLFELHNPPYSSSLHFELYKSKDDFYVQLFYRNTSEEHPLALEIPKCGTKCTLEDFNRIYSDIIPTGDFDEECRLPLYLRILEDDYVTIAREYFIALVLIALVLPIVAIISCKQCYGTRGNIIVENNNMKYL